MNSGGAERFIVSLSNQLSLMGHDVTICILLSDQNNDYIFNKQFLKDSVKFHSFEFTPGFSIRKEQQVYRYLTMEKPDVLHCHLNVLPYVYRLSIINNHIKCVHTLHNVAEKTCSGVFQKYVNRYFYKWGYIHPVTISRLCDDSYREYYNLYNSVIIDNGCDSPMKSKHFNDVLLEVESLMKSDDTIVFVHVARYHKQKNQKLLIDAFNWLAERNKDFILLVIGAGFNDGEGRELARSGCDNIYFMGLKNNVADYLYCADAFCLTSIYEGLPISLLEAMSCGLIPICTKVGGISDLVDDGKTGFLAEDVSLESYTETLIRFMDSYKNINRDVVIEKFSKDYSMLSCAQKYINVYNMIHDEN